MATSFKIFMTSFVIFFFFRPHVLAKDPTCGTSTCTWGGALVRFPFQLADHQASTNICGYPEFDLSCNNQNQTILSLPSAGDFIVQFIDYREQSISIKDPENCLPKRFLHRNVSFDGSPFYSIQWRFGSLSSYTFFNCSPKQEVWAPDFIPCLSTQDYKVIALPSKWLGPPYAIKLPLCTVISTTLAPSSIDWDLINQRNFKLNWDVPDCRSCEIDGQVCGLKKGKSLETQCSGPSNVHPVKVPSSGPSKAAKFGIMTGVGIPVLLLFLWIVLNSCNRMVGAHRDRNPQPITELSATTANQQPPMDVITGLDGPTIESYPKTQLGESWELPKPNDSTCPICLCDYRSKETLRTIPQCNHYFHASCVDEWLRINATCPVCRNPQETLQYN